MSADEQAAAPQRPEWLAFGAPVRVFADTSAGPRWLFGQVREALPVWVTRGVWRAEVAICVRPGLWEVRRFTAHRDGAHLSTLIAPSDSPRLLTDEHLAAL